MPAVVRGGRRANVASAPKRGNAAKGSSGRGRAAPRNVGGVPGKMAALGRLDLSPRAVYTLAFFVFWAVIAVGAALAVLLCSRPAGDAADAAMR